METVALYMRLSSEDDRAGESVSIANQRELLYDFVRSRREFDHCTILEFCDDGYSGMNFCRPNMQKLLALAGKTVSCIIVKDFSRFWRNLIEVGDYLDQIFPSLGVRFIAVNEGYDSLKERGSSIGLEVSLKAMVYEMYSRDISEKIRSVQRAKMQRGEYLCAIAFYGYKRSETQKNHLEIDENAANVVRRIFSMAADGTRPSQIATILNHEKIPSPLMYRRANDTDKMRGWKTAGDTTYWTRENVRRMICDIRYTGCLAGGRRTVADLPTGRTQLVPKEKWIMAEDTQEAIVSKEIYMQAQAVIRSAAQKKNSAKPKQKFRGLIKCAYCGRALVRMVCKQTYYACPTARTVPDQLCKNIYLEEARLEQVLLSIIHIQRKLFSVSHTGKDKISDLQKKRTVCQKAVNRYKTLQILAFEQYAERQINMQEYLVRKQEAAMQQTAAAEQLKEWNKKCEELQKEQNNTEKIEKKGLTREILIKTMKKIHVMEQGALEIQWNISDYNMEIFCI